MPENTTPITLPSILTVKQLAEELNQPVTAIIAKLMSFGVLATINEDIDFDTAAIVADDFGIAVIKEVVDENAKEIILHTSEEDLELRAPIVTIMGHVDHGKTTLLDTIKKTNIAAKEAGGITQHISSYQIEVTSEDKKITRKITFLDTPGHSAFEAMRRHGAKITDLVVLVVAADDGVKPQTVEAIKHAREMQVPILVAINKIDKPDADIERVKAELAEYNLVSEDWGGKTVFCQISAKQNIGITELINVILLSTDIRELKANFEVPAIGVVIESNLKPGVGPVATVLVQNGTLRIGDFVAIGPVTGRVRTLTDYKGKKVQFAAPSTPIEVSGLSAIPQFGEQLVVFDTEKESKESAQKFLRGQSAKRATSALHLSSQGASQKEGNKSVLNVIVKADTKGSLEAIENTLGSYKNEDVEVRIVSEGIGDISEGDVNMAVTAKALIIGFQVRIPASVKTIADREKVSISLYSVIYELFDSVREALAVLMPILSIERVVGKLKILARFRDNRKNLVLGGMVEEGTIQVNQKLYITRGNEKIAHGKVVSVHRGKEEVKHVQTGSECGMEVQLDDHTAEIDKNDVVNIFVIEESRKSLSL